MAALWNSIPPVREFFPPTPQAYKVDWFALHRVFLVATLLAWTPLRHYQAMGKTSRVSMLSFNGRYAWAIAEAVGPVNLIFILYTLPGRVKGLPISYGLFGTGLPLQSEIMGLMYVTHYINRAGITPLVLAPSMSPIHLGVSLSMATFQFLNSSCLGGWLTYTALSGSGNAPMLSPASVAGMILFIGGLAGNVVAEGKLFELRRGAAKRKAKSEGKPIVTYDKVYVIPPAEGLFKYVLHPHYSLEWVEWAGYWILGGAWGLGWGFNTSAALCFVISELITMSPRAWTGLEWYSKKFGVRAVAGRKAVIPGVF